MINWIKGEVIDLWQTNNKFFILINCQNLGYEIQILESVFIKLKTNQFSGKNIVLWIKHIKKEDSDSLFGFYTKEEKDFFVEILNIKGIGSQIAIAILSKLSIAEIISAINTQNKKLISSVPGIGQKMTERLILELKSKFKNELKIEEKEDKIESEINDTEINKMIGDIQLTLKSLNYTKIEVKRILPIIIKEIHTNRKRGENTSFENLLKFAMNYIDRDSSNIVR